MSNYILSCCSTVDISHEHLKSRDISYACYSFFIDGKQYADDLGQTISYEQFYTMMSAGADTKTSQINVDEFVKYFDSLLSTGKDLLHVAMSSGLSGTFNSARIAAEELRDKYPNQKIYVVDSLAGSSGYGLIIDKLADLRDGGMDIDSLYNWIEENKLNMHHWFFSTDLTFYVKGGRVPKVSGWFGTVLNICPLLNVDVNGKLIPRQKIRGKRAVIQKIVEKMKEHAMFGKDYDGKCYISHSACPDDANEVAELVKAAFPKIEGEVLINSIGTTIGSHSGPGTVALFFWGDKRVD